jgi:ABC-type transporter Mla subunit MlaD
MADELSTLASGFKAELASIDDNVSGIFAFVENNPSQIDQQQVSEFLDGIVSVAQSSREAMEQLGQFAGIVSSLGALSKALRRPGRQISDAIKTVADATAVMDDWESAAIRIRKSWEVRKSWEAHEPGPGAA